MNRKKVSIAVVSTAVAFLAVTCVTASRQTLNTPLYTFRIEQASSGMSFLSTAVNEFSYNTRDGYTLNWGFVIDRRPISLFILNTYRQETWCEPRDDDPGICPDPTSELTCPYTCKDTDQFTCPDTCGFCPPTSGFC